MYKAIRLHEYGDADVLKLEDMPTPIAKPGEILIRQEAIGVNFIDIYFRKGVYKMPSLPGVPGMEGAGIVEALGEGVTGLNVGSRVAYASALGGYAQIRTIAADRVVPLPDDIASDVAAAVMLRGLTVQMLLRQVYEVRPGQTILVHAAAGGVGLLLCQWARYLDVKVIGVVSTPEKGELARANGADHILIGAAELASRVRALTNGAMVPVVYDSTGQENFVASLDCLAPRGLMVTYGNSSGEVTGVAASMLAARGSLYLTRPTMATYMATPGELRAASSELFDLIERKILNVTIGQRYELAEAAEAQRALASRKTVGSTILYT